MISSKYVKIHVRDGWNFRSSGDISVYIGLMQSLIGVL